MFYYFCAYGTTIRRSAKVASSDAAARDTFGISVFGLFGLSSRVTCLNVGTRSPRYMTRKLKDEWQKKLAELHLTNTGNKLKV